MVETKLKAPVEMLSFPAALALVLLLGLVNVALSLEIHQIHAVVKPSARQWPDDVGYNQGIESYSSEDHMQVPSDVKGVLNNRPIIGILTQPGDEAKEEGESYFSAGYVKWLESGGARVIPVLYNLPRKEIEYLFSIISGLFIPGGNHDLSPSSKWYQAAKILFDLAVDSNDRGVPFPIHGTCLGMQLLATISAGRNGILSPVDSHNRPGLIKLTPAAKSPLLKTVPTPVLQSMQQHNISMYNHYYGLLPETFKEVPALDDFFSITATTTDRDGREYVSILEAKHYPFSGFAFHPEKIVYEWSPAIDLPHSRAAVDASYSLAQAVIDQARRNTVHQGKDIVEEDKYMIYNYKPIFSGSHQSVKQVTFFEQVYLFKIDDK